MCLNLLAFVRTVLETICILLRVAQYILDFQRIGSKLFEGACKFLKKLECAWILLEIPPIRPQAISGWSMSRSASRSVSQWSVSQSAFPSVPPSVCEWMFAWNLFACAWNIYAVVWIFVLRLLDFAWICLSLLAIAIHDAYDWFSFASHLIVIVS